MKEHTFPRKLFSIVIETTGYLSLAHGFIRFIYNATSTLNEFNHTILEIMPNKTVPGNQFDF